jgi:hypothetical protein
MTEQEQAADELTQLNQEMGLYDDPPCGRPWPHEPHSWLAPMRALPYKCPGRK